MSEIIWDWNKTLELMDGVGPSANLTDSGMWAIFVNGVQVALVDDYGCIGGIQIVRNRKEPEKHKRTGFLNCYETGMVFHCTREEADVQSSNKHLACIEREIEFYEGEGL